MTSITVNHPKDSSVNFITYQIILAQSDHINRRILNQTKFKLILSFSKNQRYETSTKSLSSVLIRSFKVFTVKILKV